MDELTHKLIQKAPVLLVAVAIALFVGGVFNAFSTIGTLMRQGQEFQFSYIFTFLTAAFYQPTILIGWAAAIHYLSHMAGRRI